MRFLETRVPPPIVTVLAAALMWALARWWPLWRFELPWPWATGFVVALLGGLCSAAGAREFRRVRTTVNPLHPERATAVVDTGIFGRTRNPMYLGMVCVLLGVFAALGAAGAALGPVVFVAYITRFQIVPEERILSAKFGAAYDGYRARVRRWL